MIAVSVTEAGGRVHTTRTYDGHVVTVMFDHQPRHNAMSQAMFDELARICDDIGTDDALRVVVIRGAGERAFVSGADIAELGTKLGPARAKHENHENHEYGEQHENHENGATRDDNGATALLYLRMPVVAAVHGYCIGGGLLLALAADIRVAADDAVFSIPAGRLGVGYPTIGMGLLTSLVGPAHAAEILFTGRRYDAKEALRIGLVNHVVAKPELDATVAGMVSIIAAQAPLSLRAAKAGVVAARRGGRSDDLVRADAAVAACWASADFVEGRAAFAAKRTAVFHGF